MADQEQASVQELDPSAPLEWTGLPITYKKRLGGIGLITGKYVYAFAPDGSLETMGALNMAILDRVMQGCFPNAQSMEDVENILDKTVYDVTAAERANVHIQEAGDQ
jgi:hypothetical protein